MERRQSRREHTKEIEMDPFTNEDFQRISQELLNDDANAHRIMHSAQEEIRERYRYLFDKNPKKGRVIELRHLSKIVKSAFSAVTYGDILQTSRDILSTEGSFQPLLSGMDRPFVDDCTRVVLIDDKTFFRETHYKKSVGHHLTAINHLLSRVTQDSIDTLKDNPTHPHYNVGQLANVLDWETRVALYGQKDTLERGKLFTYWPDSTPKDNTKVSLDLLLHLWLSGSRHAQRPLQKEEFIPFYLRHVNVLSRASTIKSQLHFNLHDLSPSASFHNYENKAMPINEITPHVSTIFTPTDTPGHLTYAHPSLTKGPWPQARMCPATTELTLPDPDKKQAADDFFNYFSNRSGITIPRSIYGSNETKGESSRTNALLLITLLFAEHTVLNNLPTQPQLFPTIRGTI